MAEHGIAGRAAQSLFADLARLVAPAGIEGGSGAANGFFGGVLAHAGTLEQPGRPAIGCIMQLNRHSGATRSVEPGISKLPARDSPDVRLHI